MNKLHTRMLLMSALVCTAATLLWPLRHGFAAPQHGFAAPQHLLFAGWKAPVAKTTLAAPRLATLVVNSLADGAANAANCPGAGCRLRDALAAAAAASDTITFGVTGTITLASELTIDKNLTIQGPGASLLTISGNNAVRVFNIGSVTPAINVTISGLTIANGRHRGADGSPGETGFGGGILNGSTGTLSLNNVVVTGNQAIGGDAVGIFAGGCGVGGGIYNSGAGTINITGSSITGNLAKGGIAYLNASCAGAGGISNNNGTLTILNSTISGNSAVNGDIQPTNGGIGNPTVIANAPGAGGIFNSGGTLNLTNSTVSDNSANGGTNRSNRGVFVIPCSSGGGILNGGTAIITNSTFSSNTAVATIIELQGSARSLGSSGSSGGGIFNAGTINLTNSTLNSNSTTNVRGMSVGTTGLCRGGAIANQNPTGVTAKNTIIAGNISAVGPDFYGTLTSQGWNLIGNNTDATITPSPGTADQIGTNAAPINPLLGPLANNGGPTQTMALLVGSPARDKGAAATDPLTNTAISTDQRGFARPFDDPAIANAAGGNGSDIGAFETQLADTAVFSNPVGPGASYAPDSALSAQKAGSVLIYNLYTSDASGANQQNTRLALTNLDQTRVVYVHLFFVDGATCSIADSFVCLTPNQTSSFLASDVDPGTSGYLVAVATDRTGCPIIFNNLIGDEFVKLSSGHAANLGAEALAALPGGLTPCDPTAASVTLNFDNLMYNALPRVLALSNIASRADGNNTLLVVNRIGGNLATGASTLVNVFGVLYDDAESPYSFSFSPGTCQFRSIISSSFPRTAPRFEQVIPAGRSGWLKLGMQADGAVSGAALNVNTNAATQSNAFNQGHNLHKLTLTTTATLTVPIFPPGC